MKLAELIRNGTDTELRKGLALVGVSALTGVGALIVIATIARAPTQVTLVNLVIFASMVVASLLSTRQAGRVLVGAVERGLDQLRLRISMAVASAEREQLARIGRTQILDRVNQSLNSISFAGNSLASALQSLCVSALAMVYVMWLAGAAMLIIGPHLAVALYLCLKYARSVLELRHRRQALQGQLLDRLTDMFDGVKEIRLHRARADAIERHYIETSAELRDVSAQVGFAWFDNTLLLTANIYALLAITVVVLPGYLDLEPDVRGPLLVAMLFVWANLRVVLMRHGLYVEAEATLVEVEQLARELEARSPGSTTLAPTTAPEILGTLRHLLIRQAGRLTRPHGALRLTTAASGIARQEFETIYHALVA